MNDKYITNFNKTTDKYGFQYDSKTQADDIPSKIKKHISKLLVGAN